MYLLYFCFSCATGALLDSFLNFCFFCFFISLSVPLLNTYNSRTDRYFEFECIEVLILFLVKYQLFRTLQCNELAAWTLQKLVFLIEKMNSFKIQIFIWKMCYEVDLAHWDIQKRCLFFKKNSTYFCIWKKTICFWVMALRRTVVDIIESIRILPILVFFS